MVTEATIKRLRWHAGLEELSVDSPPIASCTWPTGQAPHDLSDAVLDCLKALDSVNRDLNGDVPSAGLGRPGDVPVRLVYAMTEIVRMIRDSQEAARTEKDAHALMRAAWRIEAAWSAVLAGDVDDIPSHVNEEESARFGTDATPPA